MNRKLHSGDNRITRRTVTAGLGASVVAGIAPFDFLMKKIEVLLSISVSDSILQGRWGLRQHLNKVICVDREPPEAASAIEL